MVRLITLIKMVVSVRPTAIVQILLPLKMVRLATSHQQVKSDVASLSTTQQLRHGTTLIKRGIVSLDVNTLMVTSITSRKMVAKLRVKLSRKTALSITMSQNQVFLLADATSKLVMTSGCTSNKTVHWLSAKFVLIMDTLSTLIKMVSKSRGKLLSKTVRLITMMPTVELLSQAVLLRLHQTNGLTSILMAKPLKASGLSMARNTTLTKMVSNTRAKPLRSVVVTSTMTKTMVNL